MKWLSVACALAAAPAMASSLTELEAAQRAQDAVRKGHWSNLPQQCLSYQPVLPEWSFIVREEHNDQCGGERFTAPYLFTVHVDATTGLARRVD